MNPEQTTKPYELWYRIISVVMAKFEQAYDEEDANEDAEAEILLQVAAYLVGERCRLAGNSDACREALAHLQGVLAEDVMGSFAGDPLRRLSDLPLGGSR